MGDDRLEEAGLDVPDLHLYRSAGHAEVPDDALVPEVPQDLYRAAGRHQVLEARVLGVVQVDELEPVEAEKP